MRVGLDGKHQPGMPTLEFVRAQGLDGASFRSPENFTPTLDEGKGYEFAPRRIVAIGLEQIADALGGEGSLPLGFLPFTDRRDPVQVA